MGSKRKRGGARANGSENQPSRKKAKKGEAAAQAAPAEAQNLDLDKSPFAEKVAADDRRREQKVYDLLGSYDSAEHIAAADALITGLLASEEGALKRHLEGRLFRGLASSRNASRIGFSLVLSEILSQLFGEKRLAETKFTGLTFDSVLASLLEKTQPSGNISGPEERDFHFGQLFGLQCFVEAKILFGDDNKRWFTILDLLVKLGDRKVWMKSHCAWVVVTSLPHMGQERAGETLKKLVEAGWGKTAEGVGLWIAGASTYPKLKLPSKPWSDPLATKSIPELANVLKENVKQDTGKKEDGVSKAMPSSWNSQLHFVWDLILAYFIAQTKTSKGVDTEQFKLFWGTVIDDGLFSKNATEGQKYRGFLIFQRYLGGLAAIKDSTLVEIMFSRNLMKCLLNQAAKEDRYLHLAANKSLKTIEEVVAAEPAFLLPVLTQLLGKHGAYDFDLRAKAKTIEKLLQASFTEDVDAVFELLQKPVIKIKEDDVAEVEKLRRVYADYLVKICTTEKIHDDEKTEIRGRILETAVKQLTIYAYSNKDTSFSPELSTKTREYYRTRLESAFAKLTKRQEDYSYLCNAVLAIDASAVQMSDEIEAERKAANKTLKKLVKASTKKSKGSGSSLGLALLYAITILQLYNGDSDALNTLEDLKQCSEKMDEADNDASALLVEILLSLVSRPSPMMRQITQQVFESYTSQLTEDALERLTEPLMAEENIKGQQALFDAEEDEEMLDVAEGSDGSDEEDDDVEEDDISEIGSNVEFVTLNGEAVEEEDESDEEAEEGDAQAYADLDAKLEEILGSHRLDKDKDADSDDESDMTDSEMMQYDQKLAEVFKQRVQKPNKKKENQDAKETMVIFKHRILDFLDIYVKKEAQNPLAFGLLLPLLQVIRTTSTKEIGNKAAKVIGDLSDAVKKQKTKTGGSVELLQQVLQEASKDSSHAYTRAVSAAGLLLANSINDVEKVMDVYYASLKDWALRGATVQTSLYSDWLNWLQAHRKTAA